MNIRHVRLANLLLVCIMLYFNQLASCWYLGTMLLSLEVLNRQPNYLQHASALYNAIFCSYQLVLLFRLRSFYYNHNIEWIINCTEHIFFGIVICIKLYIYTAVFTNGKEHLRTIRALIVVLLFNCLGVVNEIFQNGVTHRMLFVFIKDSFNDLRMNAIGAMMFFLAVLLRVGWKKRFGEAITTD